MAHHHRLALAVAASCGIAAAFLSGCADRSAPGSVEPGPMPVVAQRINASMTSDGTPPNGDLYYSPLHDQRRRLLPLLNNPDVFFMYGRPSRSQDGFSLRSDLWIASYKFPTRPSEWALADEMEKTAIPLQQASDLQMDENGRLIVPSRRDLPLYTPDVRARESLRADPSTTRPYVNGAAVTTTSSTMAGSEQNVTGAAAAAGGSGPTSWYSTGVGTGGGSSGATSGSAGGGARVTPPTPSVPTAPSPSVPSASASTPGVGMGYPTGLNAPGGAMSPTTPVGGSVGQRSMSTPGPDAANDPGNSAPPGTSYPAGRVPAPSNGRGVPPDQARSSQPPGSK